MNYDTKHGRTSALSQIVFDQYSSGGKMTCKQLQNMCKDKGFEDVDEDEVTAAFVRISNDSGFIGYSEFISWWQLQDERQRGLMFKSEEERQSVQKIKQSFFVGTDGSDSMDKNAFQVKCYLAGYCLGEEELQEAFSLLDTDSSGFIDFPEYLRWRQQDNRFAYLVDANEDRVEYLNQVGGFFRAFDHSLRGRLSLEQFRPLYDSLVDQGEVQESFENVIKEVNADQDGYVSLNAFVKWYSGTWESAETGEEEPQLETLQSFLASS